MAKKYDCMRQREGGHLVFQTRRGKMRARAVCVPVQVRVHLPVLSGALKEAVCQVPKLAALIHSLHTGCFSLTVCMKCAHRYCKLKDRQADR